VSALRVGAHRCDPRDSDHRQRPVGWHPLRRLSRAVRPDARI